jgi:hypothetical protein
MKTILIKDYTECPFYVYGTKHFKCKKLNLSTYNVDVLIQVCDSICPLDVNLPKNDKK